MYRQTPSTNQRSKATKVKHVWTICLFLGVCFWSIDHVASDHSNSFVKLGTKGIIRSRVEEMTMENLEENKHEEYGLEDIKYQENGSRGMAVGDETFDAEVDQDNLVVDRVREGEEGDENENEEKGSEDINDEIERLESSVEETDHDADDTSSHEAHEVQYKADDASSAVSREIQLAGTENENEHVDYPNEQIDNILGDGFEENTSEETDEGEKRKELEVEVGEWVKDDTESNVTYNETEENMGSTHHSEMGESESEFAPEILTEDTSAEDLNLQDTDSEKANYSTWNVDDNHLDSESTDPDETKNREVIQQDSTDSSDSSDFSEGENTKAVGTDLDTLPEIQTEGTNSEDAA